MAVGEFRCCGCPAEGLASVYSVQASWGFVLHVGFAWLGGLAAFLGVHGLDGKDEVDRAGLNLEALFSECLVEGLESGEVR